MLSRLVLIFLAAASQARRQRIWEHDLRHRAVDESEHASVQNAFGRLLLSLDSAAAYNPSSPAGSLRPSQDSPRMPSRSTSIMVSDSVQSVSLPTETPPTTLLGGFLGAGKTTALSHMLTNREGLKIAVLVNDVAAVNVDAATMRRKTIEIDGVETVELDNGCVCCGPGAGELAPVVRSLCARRRDDGSSAFDHIVIELSGVADPVNVEKNLGLGGVDVARKVALVDANAFPGLYNSVSKMGGRVDLSGEEADPCLVDRRVIELLLQQIESADVILVNKRDLASADELQTTLAACRALNADAQIVSTTYGDAQLESMLPLEELADEESSGSGKAKPGCQDLDCKDPQCEDASCKDRKKETSCIGPTCKDQGCKSPSCKSQNAVPNSVESIGFQTYVYRARRPFSQDRLLSLLKRWPLPIKTMLSSENIASPGAERLAAVSASSDDTFANVLRSKGTAWVETEHQRAAEWSHAGRHLSLGRGPPWWATLPSEIMRSALSSTGDDETEESDAYKLELNNFDSVGDLGDRRQEIVFIGTNLNTNNIKDALDDCLLTDTEMEQYRVTWSPMDESIAAENGPFRFDIGTDVECNMGDKWAPGTIVKHFYREADWPVDRWTPYQVLLEPDGPLIFAPADVDGVIRQKKNMFGF